MLYYLIHLELWRANGEIKISMQMLISTLWEYLHLLPHFGNLREKLHDFSRKSFLFSHELDWIARFICFHHCRVYAITIESAVSEPAPSFCYAV